MVLSAGLLLNIMLLSMVSSLDNFAVGLSYRLSMRSISLLSNLIMASANAATTLATMLLGSAVALYVDPNVASCLGASVFISLGLMDLYSFSVGFFERGTVDAAKVGGGANKKNGTDRVADGDRGSDEAADHADDDADPIRDMDEEEEIDRDGTAGNPTGTARRRRGEGLDGRGDYVAVPHQQHQHQHQQQQQQQEQHQQQQQQQQHQHQQQPDDPLTDLLLGPVLPPIDLQETLALSLGLCFTNVASGIAAGLAGYPVALFAALAFASSFLLLLLGGLIGSLCGRLMPAKYVTLISGLVLLGVGIGNVPYLDRL